MASFLRSNILRRGAGDSSVEQSPNPEESPRRQQQQQQQQQSEMGEQSREGHSRGSFPSSRRFMPTLFTGRSNAGRQESTGGDNINNNSNEDEPKTPRPDQPPSSNRLQIPHITRNWTRGISRNSHSTHDDDDETTPAPRPAPLTLSRGLSSSRQSSVSVDTARYPGVATPTAVALPSPSVGGRRRFEGPDPAELHLAALADSGRRRQQRHQQRRQHGRTQHSSGSHGSPRRMRGRYEGDEYRSSRGHNNNGEEPQNFLFCFPWIQSRRLRSQILKCFVSGLLMVVMLSVYLALAITHTIGTSTFTIMLILPILFATIIFCHGLVRICMLLMGNHQSGGNRDGSTDAAERGAYPYMAEVPGPGNHGYAVPRRPIRVVLARDEEAAGVLDDGAGKLEPPAYGVWRESVRVDPNRLFWQRNEDAPASPSLAAASNSSRRSRLSHHSGSANGGPDSSSGSGESDSRPGSAASARPPSYASEDGVSYVVEARPRSMVPPPLDGSDATGTNTGSGSHLGTSTAAGASSLSVPLTPSSEYGARGGSAGTMWPSSNGGAGPRR